MTSFGVRSRPRSRQGTFHNFPMSVYTVFAGYTFRILGILRYARWAMFPKALPLHFAVSRCQRGGYHSRIKQVHFGIACIW